MAIILASKSPRRQQLLSQLGVEFTIQTAGIDETMFPDKKPEDEVARVSAAKARAIAPQIRPPAPVTTTFAF